MDWKSEAYLNRDYSKLTDEEKLKMNADEILSLYLFEISKKVSSEFYLILLKFVVGFRECLNKYGWEKKAENDESILQKYQEKQQTEPPVVIPPPDDVIKKANELQIKAQGIPYSMINNTEHAPEICNEFVTIFVQD